MKIKISDHQLFALAACFAIGDTVIAASASVASFANQDAWISAIIATIIGLAFIYLYYYLGLIYPGKTLIDIIEISFGKLFGFIISFLFIVFICFLASAQVISYIGNFFQNEYMTETPVYAFNILIAIALCVGMLYGLEAISRSAEVFVIIVTILMIIAILLNTNSIHPEHLLPVFEEGLGPCVKGALQLSSFLTWPFIFLLMIYPQNTNQTKKTRNSLLLGYIYGAGINFVCTIMSLLVLGSTITARSLYPTYLMAKEINVGILTRIEGLVSLSWILTEFIRILLYFYAGLMAFCQLMKINNYRRLVMPFALLILVFSGIVYPTSLYQATWDMTTWVTYSIMFGGIFPIALLIIAKTKKMKSLE